MASVILKDLKKSYGSAHIVKGIDLEIKDKEFAVLVGPSGCGKSTILRMIAGLETISSGSIKIGNRIVNEIPPKDRDIAMVFQSYALYPHLNVEENIAFGLKIRKTPAAEIKKKVAEAADILGLEPLLKRKPKDLSGGQRQRVAMGRAIVRKPKLFLFDEPLSNLDAKLRGVMRVEIAKISRKLQTTVLYVTHDQVEAMTLADRIIILDKGIVQQQGVPLDVYNKPANKFVATFIGQPPMNLVNGVIEKKGAALFFHSDDKKLVLPLSKLKIKKLKDYVNREVTLGIRPDSFEASSYTPASKRNLEITLKVEVIEQLGNEILLEGTLGTNFIRASVNPHTKAVYGKGIKLCIDPEKIHLFDNGTDKAIR